MYRALLEKNSQYEGIFWAGITTTGIFCRPTCTARKPKENHVEYFASTQEALTRGYRPCKICKPLTEQGAYPDWLKPLMKGIEACPTLRLKDQDLRERGIDPNRLRRWFKKHHHITFQTYLRTLRIGSAFGQIKWGDKVTEAAFDSGYESLSGFTEAFKKMTGKSPKNWNSQSVIKITRLLTPLGPMLAGTSNQGICLLEFVDRPMLETQIKRVQSRYQAILVPGNHPLFSQVDQELKEYFKGKRKQFSVDLDFKGTAFQQTVWEALIKIPYGETRSYSAQARMIGDPRATRAVAKANGDNRISILIPCHRVIGSDGHLTGYGGGIWRKQYLLDLEKNNR